MVIDHGKVVYADIEKEKGVKVSVVQLSCFLYNMLNVIGLWCRCCPGPSVEYCTAVHLPIDRFDLVPSRKSKPIPVQNQRAYQGRDLTE